jgi:Rad3-related DNA helicase
MPYNYVLNRRILSRFEKVLSGSILVFDEGHNVLEFARSGMTTSIKLSEIQSIIDLLKAC